MNQVLNQDISIFSPPLLVFNMLGATVKTQWKKKPHLINFRDTSPLSSSFTWHLHMVVLGSTVWLCELQHTANTSRTVITACYCSQEERSFHRLVLQKHHWPRFKILFQHYNHKEKLLLLLLLPVGEKIKKKRWIFCFSAARLDRLTLQTYRFIRCRLVLTICWSKSVCAGVFFSNEYFGSFLFWYMKPFFFFDQCVCVCVCACMRACLCVWLQGAALLVGQSIPSVQTGKSQPQRNGLPSNSAQIFMFPRGSIISILVIAWLSICHRRQVTYSLVLNTRKMNIFWHMWLFICWGEARLGCTPTVNTP